MFRKIIYISIIIILTLIYLFFIQKEDKEIDTVKQEKIEYRTEQKKETNTKAIQNYKSNDFVYSVFFSQVYKGFPDKAESNPENIDKKLIKLLAIAEKYIYASLYELNSVKVANELAKAKERGVDVKLVTDTTKKSKKHNNSSMQIIKQAGIPFVEDHRSAIMHNKFIIVDGKLVWTGSTNITDNGFYKNNNNSILIKSKELAENFILEFNEMFYDKSFGPRSPKLIKYPIVELQNGNIKIKSLFSPENKVDKEIIRELSKARKSIYFYMFSFTHDKIGKTIIDKYNKGIKVEGIFDNKQISSYSEFKTMKELGINVRKDNNAYFMHHKVMIIDENTTITGSFNLSKNASKRNDENVLIIKNPEIASKYIEEFGRLKNYKHYYSNN